MIDRPGRQRRLLGALAGAGIDFVTIGGHAVAAHGYERGTRDVDIVFSTEPGNCERLSELLHELDARVEIADAPPPKGAISGAWLATGGHFVFSTTYGLLDALTWIAGRDYSDLAAGAIEVELSDGTRIQICGFEDLLSLKRLAGRSRDQLDIDQLETARQDEDDEQPSS